MICPNEQCVKPVPEGANFCPACATSLAASRTLAVSNTGDAGRDIHQYQAGRDLVFYPQSGSGQSGNVPEYEVKWSWRSPLTLAALTWFSVILGVLSLGSGYKAFEPLVSALLSGGGIANAPDMQPLWIYILFGLLLLFVVAMVLRRTASNETQHLSRFSLLPAITGWGRRIGFARLKGKCTCGGRLRFYSKPVAYSPPDPQTGKQRVAEREMTAECVRDPNNHAWRVETTDRHEGGNL